MLFHGGQPESDDLFRQCFFISSATDRAGGAVK